MTENPIVGFEFFLNTLSETDKIGCCQALIDVFQERVEELDEGWEDLNVYTGGGSCSECGADQGDATFSLEQAIYGQLERATKKRAFLEMINFLNQFIHPEPVEQETPPEESAETETG